MQKYTQRYLSYSGFRRNLIRYNSHQSRANGEKRWLCVKVAWLGRAAPSCAALHKHIRVQKVFAHEKPACALSKFSQQIFESTSFTQLLTIDSFSYMLASYQFKGFFKSEQQFDQFENALAPGNAMRNAGGIRETRLVSQIPLIVADQSLLVRVFRHETQLLFGFFDRNE